jgi:hypothetical protein
VGRGRTQDRQSKLLAQRIDRLLAKELPPSEWSVERIWERGGWGFIAGEPKTYKSTFATDLAVSIASGTPFLGHFPVVNPGPVLIVQEENSEQIQWARFSRILRARDLSGKVHSFNTVSGLCEITFPALSPEVYCIDRKRFSFESAKKRKKLEAEIRAIQPTLVVLDPLQRMLGDLKINSSDDMNRVFDYTDELIKQHRCGLMIVHHYHKVREGGAMEGGQRMLGSQALHSWLTCGLYVSRQAGGRLKVSTEFRAFPTTPAFELEFRDDDGGGWADEYAVEVFEQDRRAKADAVLDYVLEHPGATIVQVAEGCGVTRQAIEQKIPRLGIVVKRKTMGQTGRPTRLLYPPKNE